VLPDLNMKDFSWLPPLITLSAHSGDLIFYMETLYQTFLTDLVMQSNTLFGKPVYVSKKLDVDGRHERFWHIITDPHNPSTSDIKYPRAERVSWIKPMIDNHHRPEVLVYERMKDRELKLHLFIPEQDFIVILVDRGNAYYFVTAFHIPYTYKLEEYRREYKKYGPKTKTAP